VTGGPRHAQAAALVRTQVADGTLKPGQAAPSGAQLARLTGFCPITCRKALRALIADGTLVRGVSPNARPRVAVHAAAAPRDSDAARALSRALAALRRAAGLSQPALAALTGYSVTTVGHAETGRLWQARAFWEKADLMLAADGELTRRYDAYRAAAADPAGVPAQPPPPSAPGPAALARVTLHWSDGTVNAFYPPSECGAVR
jgi:DNA-binding transcriptional regulator YhcF (GntR family)